MYAALAEDISLVFQAGYASQLQIAFEITVLYFALVSGILMVIVFWKLYKKAGYPGWKCLLPVYNIYNQFNIAWKPGRFFLFLFWFVMFFVSISATLTCINSYGLVTATALQQDVIFGTAAFSVVCILAMILMSIRLLIHLATAFGRKKRFAWGLAFFPILFFLVLAFGKTRYIGPQLK